MRQIGALLTGTYGFRLVALSVLIAISSSYSALDLGGRVTAARGLLRLAWLAGGATVMGIGICSMHFTGMLAFSLPVSVGYHWPTVLLSLLTAVLASSVALYVVSRQKMGRAQALAGSVLMGGGIAGTHYIAMAAMRLPADCVYSPPIVAASVLIAIIASYVALVFAFDYREDFRGTTVAKLLSATIMGVAVILMHYTGMAAVNFFASSAPVNLVSTVSISMLGTVGISIFALTVQGAAILTSSMDRQLAGQARELQSSEHFRQIAENLPIVLALATADLSKFLFVNRAYQGIWGRSVESLYAHSMSFLDNVDPGDRERFKTALDGLVRGEPIHDLECRVVRPTGSTAWVLCRGFPVRDVSGQITRLVGSAQDITERKRAEEELQRLSGRLLHLQDEERRTIARDLHDSTGQNLVALATMLGQLRTGLPLMEKGSHRLLSECLSLAEQCIREVRTLSYTLYPPVLDQAGLTEAIRDFVLGFTRRSGIQVELELSQHVGRLGRDVELALFRVVQESLINVQRHAKDRRARIRMNRNASLTLEISDFSTGASHTGPESKPPISFVPGVGIHSMWERVNFIGGQLTIDSTRGGTTVRVIIPLGDEHEESPHSIS